MSNEESSHPEREVLPVGEGASLATERQGDDIAVTITTLAPNSFATATAWLEPEQARILADHLVRLSTMT